MNTTTIAIYVHRGVHHLDKIVRHMFEEFAVVGN